MLTGFFGLSEASSHPWNELKNVLGVRSLESKVRFADHPDRILVPDAPRHTTA
jgi:hypothetical protein